MGDYYCMFTDDHLSSHISPFAHFLVVYATIAKVCLLGVPKANSPHVNTDVAQVLATCKDLRGMITYIQSASRMWLKSWQLRPEVMESKDRPKSRSFTTRCRFPGIPKCPRWRLSRDSRSLDSCPR